MPEMILPTVLLFIVGFLGATDVALYHTVSHGIREHPDSRIELVFHSLRGPTYAFLFLFIPNFAFYGAWYWFVILILIFDVGISVGDFWVEAESRDFLGGLPSGEYVLHMIIAMFFGAFVLSIGINGLEWAVKSTEIVYSPISWFVSFIFVVMAGLVFYSGFQDAKAVFRMWRLPKRSSNKR